MYFVESDRCKGCPYNDMQYCPMDEGYPCPYSVPYGYGEDYMPGE